jgi:hypothetical protein
MPFFMGAAGVMLLVLTIRNTQDDFITLLKGDFTGTGNFFWWIAAIIMIGMIGYFDKLKPISDGLLICVLLALILGSGTNFFPKLTAALRGTNSGASAISASVSSLTGTVEGILG